jgi:hypothetical protein
MGTVLICCYKLSPKFPVKNLLHALRPLLPYINFGESVSYNRLHKVALQGYKS